VWLLLLEPVHFGLSFLRVLLTFFSIIIIYTYFFTVKIISSCKRKIGKKEKEQ